MIAKLRIRLHNWRARRRMNRAYKVARAVGMVPVPEADYVRACQISAGIVRYVQRSGCLRSREKAYKKLMNSAIALLQSLAGGELLVNALRESGTPPTSDAFLQNQAAVRDALHRVAR